MTQDFNCGRKRPGRPAKKQQRILKIPEGTPLAEVQPRPRKQCINFFTKKIFLSKFLILSKGLPRRRWPTNSAARWRYRLLMENLTAHYNSRFCVSFHFCFWQEARKRLCTCLNGACKLFCSFRTGTLVSFYTELD